VKKKFSDDVESLKGEIDALEREVAFLKKEIESIHKSMQFYVERLKQVEAQKQKAYTRGIQLTNADDAISGLLQNIGQTYGQIGDITHK
jgi:predicted RNase H-like nuclease (RuvC/YqgF family)